MRLKNPFKRDPVEPQQAPRLAPLQPQLPAKSPEPLAAEPVEPVEPLESVPEPQQEVTPSAGPGLLAFPDEAALADERARKAALAREETAKTLEALSVSLLDRWNELHSELPAEPAPDTPSTPAMAQDAAAVVNTIPDAILSFDSRGTITSANAGAEAMFGYAAAELVGAPLVQLLPGEGEGDVAALLAFARGEADGRAVREWQGLRQDGSALVVELSVGAIVSGGERHGAAVVRDVSARKAAETALQRQVAETQAALEALRATQARLVQSEKMASLATLVAGIAHEINTPVGIAVTAASHLRDRMRNLSDAMRDGSLKKSQLADAIATGQQSAEMVMANLERAAELIQSFKQVAVDQTSRETREIELDVYLHETVHSLHPRIKATPHRVELLCPPGIRLHLAAGALSQVVSNIVLNALDHAFPDGQPGTVRIDVRREDEQVRLTIRDDGVGIAPEVLPRLFVPFFTTRRGAGGSGLGLHIVYNLVTQTLGGTIAVDTLEGRGTAFVITLGAAGAG